MDRPFPHEELNRLQEAVFALPGEGARRNLVTSAVADLLARLAGEVVPDLGRAASVMDIGKTELPLELWELPRPLTEDERLLVLSHTSQGAALLSSLGHPLFDLAATLAATHHERWDGKGYPKGLVGDQIPIVARIVALADLYAALTAWRRFHPGMSHAEAVRVLAGETGRFDPALLALFVAHEEEVRGVAEDASLPISTPRPPE